MIKMTSIPIEKLSVSKFNIRTMTENETDELRQSIKSKGIIEPLIIRPVQNKYEIVVGQRRFLAAKKLKIKELPCIVKKLSDSEAIEYSLIENLQRKDVDAIDIAEGLKKLVDFNSNSSHWSKTEYVEQILPKELGLGKSEIWNYLSLVNLVPELKKMVSDGKITIESGAKLKQLPEEAQKEFVEEFSKILDKPITQDTEEAIIDRTRENPEKIKEIIKEAVESISSECITIIFKMPDGESQFKMRRQYFDWFSEVAKKMEISPLQLLENIVIEKLKEWGYKVDKGNN